MVVAGAGDSGLTAALYLEKLGCTVTIVEFMEKPKASQVLLDRADENPNIELIVNTQIKEIKGEDWVNGVVVCDRASGEEKVLEAEGIYVRVGMLPNTSFLKNAIALTPAGQVPVDAGMATEMPGLYAAGDIRQNSPAQMVTAVGDGVAAAMSLSRYLNSLEN